MKSRASSTRPGPMPTSPSSRTRNSCAKERHPGLQASDRIVVGTDDERARKSWPRSTGRSTSTRRPSSTPAAARPSSSNTRRTSPPRSPSSTRSRISPRRSAPMCRRSRAASASTTASGRSSYTPAPASAARASRRYARTAQDRAGSRRAVAGGQV